MIRTAAELADVDEPAWPVLQRAIDDSVRPVRVLPVTRSAGERVLERLQVTTRSVLGALALECGGLVLDGGWLRVLGGGADGLPDLASANALPEEPADLPAPGALVIASDVLGGRFAVDGGGLGVAMGEVCYFAPDTLRWEALGLGHAAFVLAMLSGASTEFYAEARWPGWEADCSHLPLSQGYSVYPPPFSAQGQDPSATTRRPVPMAELFDFYDDMQRQLGS